MELPPAALDPVKPLVLHPRLAELWLIQCQTSPNSLIYGANFGNYVRVTDSDSLGTSSSECRRYFTNWWARENNPVQR